MFLLGSRRTAVVAAVCLIVSQFSPPAISFSVVPKFLQKPTLRSCFAEHRRRRISSHWQRQPHVIAVASNDPLGPSSPIANGTPVPRPQQQQQQQPTPKKKKLQSFARYLEVECWKQQPEIRPLSNVLQSLADACKQINRIVQRAQTDELYGNAHATGDATNIQGEVPQKLDVLCNTVVLRALCGGGKSIHAVASEEEDEPRTCAGVMGDGAFGGGDFVAVFDPIDGSKNIDASLPVGTIFGVYKKKHVAVQPGARGKGGEGEKEDLEELFCQDGSSLVAAGYCLYS